MSIPWPWRKRSRSRVSSPHAKKSLHPMLHRHQKHRPALPVYRTTPNVVYIPFLYTPYTPRTPHAGNPPHISRKSRMPFRANQGYTAFPPAIPNPVSPHIPRSPAVKDAPVIPVHSRKLRANRFYSSCDEWHHISRGVTERLPPVTKVHLVTWNIDEELGHMKDRIEGILFCIQRQALGIAHAAVPPPCIIMLQEVQKYALAYLRGHPWVRDYFSLLPLTDEHWDVSLEEMRAVPGHGNVTLVSRHIPVEQVRMLDLKSSGNLPCTATLTYIRLHTIPNRRNKQSVPLSLVVANTQLNTSRSKYAPFVRFDQLQTICEVINQEAVDGAIVAGDMLTTTTQDARLRRQCGLKDAGVRPSEPTPGLIFGSSNRQGSANGPASSSKRAKFLYRYPHEQHRYYLEHPRRFGLQARLSLPGTTARIWASRHPGLVTTLRVQQLTNT
ncbi:hypothetical protein FISHEDRAFT_77757 [Fistulina hepatica ATCC 64428]|nr:hypothetical protein FISHEDRAFT_77757 [Fistulina hepatica ATCC 64428]